MPNILADREERLIDDPELCSRWGWHPKTPGILRSRRTMPIPFVKIGKSVRYKLTDVEAFEARNTVQPAPRVSA